jgi:hypothetical protein
MPNLYADIEINAPRAAVWEALVRKDQWQFWNTYLYDGDPARPFQQGQEVFLLVRRLEEDESTEFEPIITLLQPQVCLRWLANMPGFKSEQVFELQDLGPNRTKYIHQERFTGFLSRLFLPFMRQDEKIGIKRMAFQLKRYVERQAYREYRQRGGDRPRPVGEDRLRDRPYEQPHPY